MASFSRGKQGLGLLLLAGSLSMLLGCSVSSRGTGSSPGGTSALERGALADLQPPPSDPVDSLVGEASERGKVLLLSLDGAGAEQLTWLYELGALDQGGFARFFDEGLVAASLVPPNPTLTASSHVTLSTGFSPGETGIVANRYQAPSDEGLRTTSGFSGEIETETLWEAARRQGLEVGALAWIGVDFTNARRSADWGYAWAGRARFREHLLEATTWQDSSGDHPDDCTPCSVSAHELSDDASLRLFTNERSLWAQVVTGEAGPATVLSAGSWNDVPVPQSSVALRLKWLEGSSDPRQAVLLQAAHYDPPAYPESFKKQLGKTGWLWPGAPSDRLLEAGLAGKTGIDMETWLEQSDSFSSLLMFGLRQGLASRSWDLALGYLPVIDEAGHAMTLTDSRQPRFETELPAVLGQAVVEVWRNVDRELAALIEELDLSTTTLVVVSDHGMAPVHATVYPNVLFQKAGLVEVKDGQLNEASRLRAVTSGNVAHVYANRELSAERKAEALELAKVELQTLAHEGEQVFSHVLTREEASSLNLAHANSGDLVAFTRVGFYLASRGFSEGVVIGEATVLGMHGAVNTDSRMHGIFLAVGRGVEPSRAPTMRSTEVAPWIAERLGIDAPGRRPQTDP